MSKFCYKQPMFGENYALFTFETNGELHRAACDAGFSLATELVGNWRWSPEANTLEVTWLPGQGRRAFKPAEMLKISDFYIRSVAMSIVSDTPLRYDPRDHRPYQSEQTYSGIARGDSADDLEVGSV